MQYMVYGLGYAFRAGGFIALDYLTVLYQLQNLTGACWDVGMNRNEIRGLPDMAAATYEYLKVRF
jgi:hypothetical protein